jgi:hypothetical protein
MKTQSLKEFGGDIRATASLYLNVLTFQNFDAPDIVQVLKRSKKMLVKGLCNSKVHFNQVPACVAWFCV